MDDRRDDVIAVETSIGELCGRIDFYRNRARILALVNPMAFYVSTGSTLPEYLKLLDNLESRLKELPTHAKQEQQSTAA